LNGIVFLVNAQAAESPKGPTLAVASNVAEANIWLMNPNGKNQRPLLFIDANPLPLGLAWSPDGRRLAFHTDVKQNIDIYVVGADGENLRRLTDDPAEDSFPSWHPGGKRISFATNRDGNFEIYEMIIADLSR